jgi:Rrf2 family protein
MKLTRASSYALHAVAYMAQQKNSDKPVASHKIAQERGIPERFLLKVLKPLVSARVLLSIKGPNGGYRLARPAKDISLLDVVEAVEGPIRGSILVTPGDAPRSLDRRLEGVFEQATAVVRKHLQKVRIADLAGNHKQTRRPADTETRTVKR